jgi:hypothetical protein
LPQFSVHKPCWQVSDPEQSLELVHGPPMSCAVPVEVFEPGAQTWRLPPPERLALVQFSLPGQVAAEVQGSVQKYAPGAPAQTAPLFAEVQSEFELQLLVQKFDLQLKPFELSQSLDDSHESATLPLPPGLVTMLLSGIHSCCPAFES